MDINISIVTYHTCFNEISQLIHELKKNDIVEERIFIIDNSSNNNLKKLKNNFHKINYLFLNKNLGYGKAHNIAIRNSIEKKSKYHIVLNPDIELLEDTLYKLFVFMEENKEVGLLSPKILYKNGDLQNVYKLLPNPFNLIIRRFLPANLFEKYNNIYELADLSFDNIHDIPSVSGCFMLFRVDVLKKIGAFDERYFMYLEDVDISRRVNQVSRTIYYPFATVTHGYNKESYRNYKLTIIHIISAIRYFNKWGWIFDKNRVLINKQIKK